MNENQELLNNWNDKTNPRFCFYQTKFNIILRDPDETGNWIVAQTGVHVFLLLFFLCAFWSDFFFVWVMGLCKWCFFFSQKQVCVAAKFTKPNIFFVASGLTKSKGKKVEGESGFAGAPGALTAIQKHVWDAFYEYQDAE